MEIIKEGRTWDIVKGDEIVEGGFRRKKDAVARLAELEDLRDAEAKDESTPHDDDEGNYEDEPKEDYGPNDIGLEPPTAEPIPKQPKPLKRWQAAIQIIIANPEITPEELIEEMKNLPCGAYNLASSRVYCRDTKYMIDAYQEANAQ